MKRQKNLDRKNLSIHLNTYEHLKEYGGLGDSFSDVIDYIIAWSENMGMNPEVLKTFKRNMHK